jgi:hypothetical protein
VSDVHSSHEVNGKLNVLHEAATARVISGSVEGITRRAVIESECREAQFRQANCELPECRVRIRVFTAERRTKKDRPAR